jgi:CubicO group peptidase (beta-lactamase class C family)
MTAIIPLFLKKNSPVKGKYTMFLQKTTHLSARCAGLVICFILCVTSLCAQRPQQFSVAQKAEDVGFSSERLARLDTFIQGLVDRRQAASITTFVARKGKIVHHKAFGFSVLEKNKTARTDDIYRIMSQTKLITTVGLLTLLEEGRFYLDQPISDFLPAFAKVQVLEKYDEKDRIRYVTRAPKRAITFRHILSHTAGIPYLGPLSELPEFKIPFLASTGNETLAEVCDRIAAMPLEADPGEKYVYGSATDVAGRLIEVMSGQTLDVFLKNRVCDPLGMTDTYFYLPKEKASRLVELYSQEKRSDLLSIHASEIFRKYPLEGGRSMFFGGSGMSGTISDYARLCQMLANGGEFNGKRILSPATVRTMMTNQIGDLSLWDRLDSFGLGLAIFAPGSRYGDIATPGAVNWGGYFGTEYTIDPEKELVLLVYTNVQPYAFGAELQRKFRTLVYAALME